MRIIIVDDEAFFRISFKSLIDWEKYGFEIAAEASNGKEALNIIDSIKPDIVFLDITMPLMNGIEVLEKLKEKDCLSKVIVLSSYDEFEYVRQAMKLGAVDYLHKPAVKAQNVVDVLMNAKKQLQEERAHMNEFNNLKNQIEKNRTNIKKGFLSEIVNGTKYSAKYIDKNFKELDIKIKAANITCFVLSIDDIIEVEKRYNENNKHMLKFALKNITKEILSNEEEIEYFSYGDNKYICFKSYSKIRSTNEVIVNNNHIARLMKDALKQFLNVDVSVGISGVHNSLQELCKSFDEASIANGFKFFLGKGKIIYYDDINFCSSVDFSQRLNEINSLMDNGDLTKLKDLLMDTSNSISEKRLFNEVEIRSFYKNVYYILRGKYKKITKKEVWSSNKYVKIDRIIEAENIDELNKIIFECIGILIDKMNSKFNHVKNEKIKEVFDYIEMNYNKDISLSLISEEVNLNSSYLSRLFKKETGVSLMSYINKLRIDKAIEHIKNSSLKNYEIADLVGFKSVEYFYIAFKKITGKSPSEYK